ncbi:MAG: ABC transporter permease [Bryobacteraceae bacterium]
MRDTWFIARTDLTRLLLYREVILWTFIMPLIFFYFMTGVNRGMTGKGEVKDRLGVLVPANSGYLAGHLKARLEQRNFDVRIVTTEAALQPFSRRLRIPPDFTASVTARRPVTLEFERATRGTTGDYDELRIKRAVYTVLADCGLLWITGAPLNEANVAAIGKRPRLITVESRAAGKRLDPPSGAEQGVPGTMVMFALLVSFTTGAISLVIQRRNGTLRRLAFAPLSRTSIVAGKWAARWMLAAVQLVYAMVIGTFVFHVRWGSQLLMIVIVMLCYTALAASLGVLLGNLARNEKQTIGFGVVASNLLAALGGCWWPIEVTPEWAQRVAICLPTGWAMDAMHKLISFEMPAASVLPHILAMLAGTLLAGWMIARRFRFE